MRISATFVVAAGTVAVGMAAFVAADILRPETRTVTFETESRGIGPLESINGVPFTRAKGIAVVTEPLAHVRLPLGRTLLGKHLMVRPRFHLDEGEVFEVGVKKTSFWLDYDRLPLAHRILDHLLVRDDTTWSALRSGARIAYLNPRFQNPWKTLEDFEKSPPTDGPIGLYGNAKLECGSGQRAAGSGTCVTVPFRVSETPDAFRAIYAFYPEPNDADSEWTENTQRFDLARAYQNDDGSIDMMFFTQRKDGGPIRLLLDSLEFRIEPGWPNPRDLLVLLRRNLTRLVRRSAVSQSDNSIY